MRDEVIDTSADQPIEDIGQILTGVGLHADGLPIKLTQADIDVAVQSAQFCHFPGTQHMVVCLKLFNSFTVVGESCCVRPELFDEELGKKYATEDAIRKVWQLEGYRFADAIYQKRLYDEAEGQVPAEVEAEPL